MDLWIRSQNKLNLIKVNNSIDILEDFYIVTNYRELENGQESWDLLGKYETKERALEILDKIQNRIKNMDKRDFLGMQEANYISNVYQMPED